ncbi:site-specific DNA-methyltransferase (adenine-specific) [Marinilabilia salmonicolor]|jgi:site-specific DNA-methyltransferase (adenine-specific)|uniref:DNA methyltransferase n=1 Tax=Marinilabilia salmonicolor TaxID=989 RepID=UPI000D3F6AD6|nr:DNA methyltransferase [Marinilabilia salmonicolor]PRY89507.1 site-specific DNA-methyltransferase (adenine-specific) [Marinilabilia salmonicolor]
MELKTKHKIINGDSRNMDELTDNSVDLVITSPPYWQLKDYGTENQIGYNDSYEEYINHLNLVWKECYRVLDNGSRLCVNIGDQFARAVYYGRYKVIPIRTEIIKFCEAIGFDYMGAIMWQKKTTSNTTGGASLMGSYPYPKNGIISIDYEFILIFKKLGTPKKPTKEIKEMSKMTKEEWKTYFDGHWYFGGAKQDGHIAMFPEELPKRLIKMFAFVGDTVLDPFLGSGTTSLAARNLNRNSVGYEMNPEFIPFIEKKLEVNQGNIFDTNYEFIKQDKLNIDFKNEIKDLPYVFKDFHKFDKKTDPKKLQYGSKIDQNGSTQREDYFSVKEILSPELVKLNNDLIVRLIGIKEKKETNGKAIEFLQLKTKGQKVFLKYDETKHDEKNNLLVYLYLKNKTFLNAHLIKNGFADVDTTMNFKNKDKFINYLKEASL